MVTQSVPPLLYSQVRMLAEAALGIPNQQSATYTFDPANTNGPLVVPPGAGNPRGVTVPATNATKFTRPGPVLLEVEIPTGLATLDATRYGADAVFWSTAAVQKFVLPYYASCMGYRAAESLAMLETAWNGDIPGVEVFALMHVAGTPVQAERAGEPVEPLWVVYLADGFAQARSLADFARRYPATLPPQDAPPPVPYIAPTLDQVAHPYPDYTTLRSMAEWAASLDVEPMYFTYYPHARQFGAPTAHAVMGGGAIVVPVFNPFVRRGRLAPAHVRFGGVDLAADCDAVLWSTGAIEQFLLPYYASLDGFAGLSDLQALRDSWTENRPFVGGNIVHDGKEVHYLAPKEAGETTIVMAITHIWPSMMESEDETRTTAVRNEVRSLQLPGSGGTAPGPVVNARAEEGEGAA